LGAKKREIALIGFVEFCQLNGLLIDSLPPAGRWGRYKTHDKPKKKNGSAKWLGSHGFCINWATQTEPAVWRPDGADVQAPKIDRELIERAERETALRRQKAAQRAEWTLTQCELSTHPYFAAKGFPEHLVNVWDGKAVIPMRNAGRIVGCQLIDEPGNKKFLPGQASGGAEFVMDGKGMHVVCEGYATGLSVRQALANLKTRATIHVCFSAGNMARIAAKLPRGLVIADNDASGTGERVAKEIGWPYWMSEVVGEDANDAHQRAGLFKLAMGLRVAMRC
jgi:putative DNA primase/helicase